MEVDDALGFGGKMGVAWQLGRRGIVGYGGIRPPHPKKAGHGDPPKADAGGTKELPSGFQEKVF